MRERRVGILLVVRQYGSEYHRNSNVCQENNRQRRDDGDWDGSLWILGFFSRGGHAVETDESVEAFCRAGYNASYTIRSESASPEFAIIFRAFRLCFPVVNVSCRQLQLLEIYCCCMCSIFLKFN